MIGRPRHSQILVDWRPKNLPLTRSPDSTRARKPPDMTSFNQRSTEYDEENPQSTIKMPGNPIFDPFH